MSILRFSCISMWLLWNRIPGRKEFFLHVLLWFILGPILWEAICFLHLKRESQKILVHSFSRCMKDSLASKLKRPPALFDKFAFRIFLRLMHFFQMSIFRSHPLSSKLWEVWTLGRVIRQFKTIQGQICDEHWASRCIWRCVYIFMNLMATEQESCLWHKCERIESLWKEGLCEQDSLSRK